MANGPYVASLKLPFSQFPGIDPEAARRIWRDFEAVGAALMAVPSIWDAIIDPTLTSSIPSLHQYVNLTDLIANETWATTRTFKVGVKTQCDVAIVEPNTIDISTRGDLALFGLGEPVADATHVVWSWKTLFGNSTQQVYLHNLSIGGGFSTTIVNGAALLIMDGCYFDSNITSPVASGVSNNVIASDCYWNGNVVFGSGSAHLQTHYLLDCIFTGSLTIGNLVTATVQGGAIGTAGSKTLTITGSGSAYVSSAVIANLTIDASGSNNIVVVNSALGGNVTVSATVPNVSVTGDWGTVSFTGTAAGLRRFNGSGDSCDFTGPGQVSHTNKLGGAGHNVKLRGAGVIAQVSILLGVAIQGLSLTHSVILADYAVASTFLLDASSTNNLAILGGTHVGGWGGTTDSGTNNRIITETSDSILSGYVTTTLASAHLLVGSAGNVATDTAITGDVTISNTGVTTIKTSVALAGSPTTTTQAAADNSTKIATTAYVDAAAAAVSGAPTGSIVMWPAAAAPTGWVICDGSSQLRAGTFAALFAVIGTTYGSVDGTHFTLPDLRDREVMGVSGSKALASTGGNTTQAISHTLTFTHTHTLPTLTVDAHTHALTAAYAKVTSTATSFISFGRVGTASWTEVTTQAVSAAAGATAASRTTGVGLGGTTDTASVATITGSGGTTASQSTSALGGSITSLAGPLDPYIALNYIIKT